MSFNSQTYFVFALVHSSIFILGLKIALNEYNGGRNDHLEPIVGVDVELVAVLLRHPVGPVSAANDRNSVQNSPRRKGEFFRKRRRKVALLAGLPVEELDRVDEVAARPAADDHVPAGI